MSPLRIDGVVAAVLLLAACAGSDSTEATGAEESAAAAPDESSNPETTTLAAMADGAGAGMCELPSGGYTDACNSCLAARCCGAIEDCKGDAECSEQLRCIVECQDAADPAECSMACTSASGVHEGYVAYDDCSFAECLDTCWM